jgi:hypothetical protein
MPPRSRQPVDIEGTEEEFAEGVEEPGEGIDLSLVNTQNQFTVHPGQNLPNHTTSMAGRGKYVRLGMSGPIVLRTKQEVYRLIAWLEIVEEIQDLPHEDEYQHTIDDVREAIQSL